MADLIQVFGDVQDKDGGLVNSLNIQGNPLFINAEDNNFALSSTLSPAFAAGDAAIELAGSDVSDVFNTTDASFTDVSGDATGNVQTSVGQDTVADVTNDREESTAETKTVITPSVGAFEIVFQDGIIVAAQQPAAVAVSLTPGVAAQGSQSVDVTTSGEREVTLVFAEDQTEDETTEERETEDDDTIVVGSDGRFEVIFDADDENIERVDEDGEITVTISVDTTVWVDTWQNSTDVEAWTPPVQGGTFTKVEIPEEVLRANDGTRICTERMIQLGLCDEENRPSGALRTTLPCPIDRPLIGVDYNLNTLLCISEQYDRKVQSVPLGLGVAWAVGPPSLRLRRKNVYRVTTNSPAGSYIK